MSNNEALLWKLDYKSKINIEKDISPTIPLLQYHLSSSAFIKLRYAKRELFLPE